MSRDDSYAWISELYEKYATDVLRVSYFYLGDRQQAEDVTQDVFVRLMENQPDLKEGSEKSWLLKVALNRCRDLWRSAWMKRVLVGTPLLEILPAQDEVDDHIEKEALMQSIHALAPEIREVFLLFYYQSYSIAEIATMLDVPEGTISSRLSRGRKKLKAVLGDEDTQEGSNPR